MMYRNLVRPDLVRCLDVYPTVFSPMRKEAALTALESLLCHPAFRSVVIENASSTLLGFGASVFVTPEFCSDELAKPTTDLNARILQSAGRSRSAVLGANRIAAVNAGDGLDLVVLCGRWSPHLTDHEAIRDVGLLLERAFVRLHQGFRLRRMLVELRDEQDHAYAESSRLWRIHCRHPGGTSLAVIERADALGLAGSILGPLFRGIRPQLGLRCTDQDLLTAALELSNDSEIAEALHISTAAVKRRWAMIFDRLRPWAAQIGIDDRETKDTTRGKKKRDRVIAYVREHPEELRPYSAKVRRPPYSQSDRELAVGAVLLKNKPGPL